MEPRKCLALLNVRPQPFDVAQDLKRGRSTDGRADFADFMACTLNLNFKNAFMFTKKKKLSHAVPPWVEDGALFFITVNCGPRGVNQLCHPEKAEHLRQTVAFRQAKSEWWVRLFVVMPDHCHGLISFSRNIPMQSSITNWKRFTARNLQIDWQDDFFDHRIRDLSSLQEKEMYLANNPVRKGLCRRAEDWPYTWRAADLGA